MSVIAIVILTAGMLVALLCALADQVLLSRIGGTSHPSENHPAPR